MASSHRLRRLRSAVVDQSAYQSNENNLEDGDQDVRQGQLIGQFNLSAQSGVALAAAFSNDVKVRQFGDLDAGGDGINASSTAGRLCLGQAVR